MEEIIKNWIKEQHEKQGEYEVFYSPNEVILDGTYDLESLLLAYKKSL